MVLPITRINRFPTTKVVGYEIVGWEITGWEITGWEIVGWEIVGYDVVGYDVAGYDVAGCEIAGYASAFRASVTPFNFPSSKRASFPNPNLSFPERGILAVKCNASTPRAASAAALAGPTAPAAMM